MASANVVVCQRPYSIRTRIKTTAAPAAMRKLPVRDHIPLEQGLRLEAGDKDVWQVGQRPYSIRTRIKTWFATFGSSLFCVRDHIPLEQGLRRMQLEDGPSASPCQRPYSIRTRIKTRGSNFIRPLREIVRDHIPLEQGLRLTAMHAAGVTMCQRPYSIRTRIKTPPGDLYALWLLCQRPYSIRTRIKTYPQAPLRGWRSRVRDHIPLEQGLRQSIPERFSKALRSETIFH